MWLRLTHVGISPFVISISFHHILPSPRFACPCARISRHLFFYPLASDVSVAEAHSCWYKPTCHFHVISCHFITASVCVPVCTHFEALHFYPPASYVSVAEAHSCWYKPICHFHIISSHSAIASVCMPVCTHFEAPLFLSAGIRCECG